jgi:PTS system fructose-specific IIA component/PTS system nitrogen regulatory IIA component
VTFRFPEWSLEVPEGASKEDLIRQALARMTAEGILPAQLEGPAAGALLRREQLGSTGIGRRVGVPHTRLPGLHGLVGAFFRLSRPVDFDSLDAEPITRLAVVLSAPERPGDELRAMELLMLHLRRLSEWPD